MPMQIVGHLRQTTDTGARVLLVDGDRAVRRTVVQALPGMAVCPAGSAKRALRLVAAEPFAAAILDVSLPDGDGRDLCATLRRRGLTLLMLSGLGREAEIVRGLEAGADDYVVKPFRPHELAARVRAQLRQHDSSDHAELPVGEQTFRPGDRTLSWPGHPRPVRLTDKEAAVLKYLYRAQGRPVTARSCCGTSGGARSTFVRTHSRSTSTGCGARSSRMPTARAWWSTRAAATA